MIYVYIQYLHIDIYTHPYNGNLLDPFTGNFVRHPYRTLIDLFEGTLFDPGQWARGVKRQHSRSGRTSHRPRWHSKGFMGFC